VCLNQASPVIAYANLWTLPLPGDGTATMKFGSMAILSTASLPVTVSTACPYILNQTKKNAPLSDNEIITVTHPFLPNSGKKYFLIGKLMPHGKETLLCQNSDGNEVLIPSKYTDLKEQDFFQDQANGRCDFRYDDLQSLAELIEKANISV